MWRVLGTSTLRWSVIRSARSNLQFIGIGGVDYFQQDNNFVSPPELEFEPNDGQPGTVVLSKSSNRNLNLALNATHTYLPGDPDRDLSGPPRPGSSSRSGGSLPRRSWAARF